MKKENKNYKKITIIFDKYINILKYKMIKYINDC